MQNTSEPLRRMFVMLGAFVVAVAWLVPNHYPPWLSFYNEATMGAGLILLALANFSIDRSRGIPAAACVVAALIVIPWTQWLFGLLAFSGDAWVSSLYLLGFTSAIVVAYQWNESRLGELAISLSIAAVAAASISSVIGLVQVLNGGVLGIWSIDGLPGMQAKGNLAQPNHLALLIGFGAVGLLFLRERRLLGRTASIFLLGLLVLGIGLTRSRAALLYGIVIALGVYTLSKRNNVSFQTHPIVICIAAVLQWVVAWGASALEEPLAMSISQSLAERGLQSSRYQAWTMFAESLKDAPWAGYGWLQTAEAQLAVAHSSPPIGELFSQAHSLFLELLIWCGIPLGLLLIGTIIYWFFSRATKVASVESICGLLVVALLSAHAMVEFPEQYVYFLIPAGLWIGIVERSIASSKTLPHGWTYPLFAAGFSLWCVICVQYLVVEEDFRLARFEYLKIGSLRAVQPEPEAPLLSNLTSYVRFYRMNPSAGMSDHDLRRMELITKRYPYAKLLYGYSAALALNGRLDEGRRVFLLIRQVHGQRIYEIIKDDVRERIMTGQVGLESLEQSLPQ
jgi:uncharacterized membrane protein